MSSPALHIHPAQGLAPQSRAPLSVSDVLSEADALSRALSEAQDVAKDAQKKADSHPELSGAVKLEYESVRIMQVALQKESLLPVGLLPAYLPPSDLLSASSALDAAIMSQSKDQLVLITKDTLRVTKEVLGKATESPDFLRDVPNLPPLSTELGPPRHFDYGATIKRVRIGVMIELATIPLYLYAMYSVRPDTSEGLRVRALVRGILQQEMLHLALCGNLLSALGGSVALYDPRVVPIYPAPLLCSKIPMHLEALNTANLGRFMEIEAPVDASHPASHPDDRNILASQYDSIGQLYEDVVLSVRGLEDQRFTNNLNNQFVGQDFFGSQLFAITDQSTALQALGTIIEQGEGNLNVEDSHYEVLSKLYSGPAWDVYEVPTNPKTEDYMENPYPYRLSLSFDAAYCYLLQTIQRVWQTDDVSDRLILLRNIHGIMTNVLTPLAELLVQEDFKDGCAAPCFNYYPMRGTISKEPLEPRRLHQALVDEVGLAAIKAPSDDDIGRAAQEAAGRVDLTAQDAAAKAATAAPNSADAVKTAEIVTAIEEKATQIRNASPSEISEIVELASQLSKDAVQAAIHTRNASRIGANTVIRAALAAADAADEINSAVEATLAVIRRANSMALLNRLKSYIEDNLYPPF